MAKWFVRTRGRVIGPFPENELRAMRAARQLQGFDEVSKDQLTWQAMDLSPIFGPPEPAPSAMPIPTPQFPTARPPVGNPRGTDGRLTWWIVGGVTALIVVVGVLGVVLTRGRNPMADSGAKRGPEAATVPRGVVKFGPGVTPGDRDAVLSATVGFVVAGATITTPEGAQYDTPESTGTGFVVTPEGHLLTNMHVVDSVVALRRSPIRFEFEQKKKYKIEPKLWVFFGRSDKYEAELIHTSENYDVAVLKVGRPCAWHFALCNTPVDDIPKLDAVSSIGFPGIDRDPLTLKDHLEQRLRDTARGPVQSTFPEAAFEVSKRDGSVTKRTERKNMGEGQQDSYVLQHSAQIFGGNSGGPLLTRAGQVIGINTWGRSKAMLDSNGKVIGKAEVNINYALTLPQLRAEIDKHVPGVTWQPLAAD